MKKLKNSTLIRLLRYSHGEDANNRFERDSNHMKYLILTIFNLFITGCSNDEGAEDGKEVMFEKFSNPNIT